MPKRTVSRKENKELIKIAEANGARIVYGKSHALIYDGSVLVTAISYGGNGRDRYPGGMMGKALKMFKARGWKV